MPRLTSSGLAHPVTEVVHSSDRGWMQALAFRDAQHRVARLDHVTARADGGEGAGGGRRSRTQLRVRARRQLLHLFRVGWTVPSPRASVATGSWTENVCDEESDCDSTPSDREHEQHRQHPIWPEAAAASACY
jgi:hypothetical protein